MRVLSVHPKIMIELFAGRVRVRILTLHFRISSVHLQTVFFFAHTRAAERARGFGAIMAIEPCIGKHRRSIYSVSSSRAKISYVCIYTHRRNEKHAAAPPPPRTARRQPRD